MVILWTFVNDRAAMLLRIMPLLLVPSGCAALIYQVTWVRLLGLSMGSTSAAVSTVLTAFFLGMAIGSYFAKKISWSGHAGLIPFVILELAIGACGLILLPVLLNLDYGMALLGESGTSLLIKFFVSLVVLIAPTVCMGATFPVLAAALIEHQRDMGSQVGRLYALNTAGAVLGALLSGFVLTPRIGLDGAVYVACFLNLAVAITGFFAYRKLTPEWRGEPALDSAPSDRLHDASTDTLRVRIALVLFFTGFVAIASEVAWTKYLSIFTGTTLYGFAAILSIFLTGIALGSWAAKRYLRQSVPSRSTVASALVTLGATLLFARVGLAQLPTLLEFSSNLNQSAGLSQSLKYFAVFIVLFPATFVFGGLFPVTLSMYCARVSNLRHRIGRGYAVNTVGSIFGSVAAGFWIIPRFGTNALLTATVVATLALSWLFVDPRTRLRQRTFTITILCILLAGSWQLPHLDYAELIAANPYRFDSDAMEGKKPRFMFLEEGKASVISVVTYDEQKARLQSNGIQESYLSLSNAVKPPFTEVLLGLVPYFLHPDPTSVFVVGFGGGHTVQALADTSLQNIRIVELEPAVISAVAAASGGEITVLQDDRIRLKINDARNSLLVEDRSYDLIVSQPSHPWLAGAGNLFTRQFFKIAAAHLNDGGIFAQWVNLFNMDATTLRSILQAYFQVFPQGFTMVNTTTGDLLLFGSEQPLIIDYARIEQRMRRPGIKNSLAKEQIRGPEALLWYFAMSREEALAAAADMPPNTDTRIISEVRLAGMTVEPDGDENPYKLVEKHSSLDVLSYIKPDDAARMLYLAGNYFYRNHSTTRTRNAMARLEPLDPAMARDLDRNWAAWRESVRNRSGPLPVPR